MSRWFRMYDEMLDDPKVQRLAPHLFRIWVNLLCLASKHEGKLPAVSEIAFRLRMSESDAQSAVEELILAGLIDIDAKGGLAPHNWQGRQFASDTSKNRTQNWRKRKASRHRDGGGDVTVTAAVTGGDGKCDAIESESESDTDKDSYGLSSFPEAARARDDDRRDFKSIGKRKEKLVRRAEGLGIPVDELTATLNRHNPKKRAAYFTTLCVEWLHPRLPGLDEQIIRDALWGTDEQYAVVMRLMLEAA